MKRLSNYEKATLISAAVALIVIVVSILWNFERGYLLSISILLFLALVTGLLLIIRLDKIASKQQREREEIYKVLYQAQANSDAIQANSEAVEHQNRKTREHLGRHIGRIFTHADQEAQENRHEAEIQGRKTREHLSRHSNKLHKDFERVHSQIREIVKASESASAATTSPDTLQNLAEVMRLRSNALTSQLDAHWMLLQEISDHK